MLASVIVNRYSLAEVGQLADAIEELCSPNDDYGWSSSGIYCFWDFKTKEVLYIGLAIDLPLRFRQHNGLANCPRDCCKWDRIQEYFQNRLHIGYSTVVQSPMTQAITHRWESARPGELEWIAESFGYFDTNEVKGAINKGVVDSLRVTESTMLAAYKKDHGRFPIWNEMGGLKLRYSSSKMDSARYFIRSFTNRHSNYDPLLVRCTFRELCAHSIFERYETFLHGARILLLGLKIPMGEACKRTHDGFGDLPQILNEQYLMKLPQL